MLQQILQMGWNIKNLPFKPYLYGTAIIGLVLFGWYCRGIYEDSKKVTQLEKRIESHNEGTQEVAETVKVVEKIVYKTRTKILEVPALDTSNNCPISDLTRLRNQTIEALDPKLFESSN